MCEGRLAGGLVVSGCDRNIQCVNESLNGRWWAMNKFEGRIGAGAIGRGLGPLAALTLVAV